MTTNVARDTMRDTSLVGSPGIWATVDRAKLRADTPGCEQRIHLNNAGSALPPRTVNEAVISYLKLEERIGGYEAAEASVEHLERGREQIARLLGTKATNLALVESSTVALHRALSSIPLRTGDRVLVTQAEYAATMLPLIQLTSRIGLRVEVIPDGPDGTTDSRALARMLDDDVKIVSAVHAPSHNGLINDVASIGRTIATSGSDAWYIVDACQSVGQLPVSATEIGSDFLYASGRKYLRGPRGTGMLATSDRVLAELDAFPVDVYGGEWTASEGYRISETATRFETFERSYATVMGLFAAVDYALEMGIEPLSAATRRNAEYLRARIGALGEWEVLDRGRDRSGIVTIRHLNVTARETFAALAREKINTSVVRPAVNRRDLGDTAALRLSPHAYNNCQDLDAALSVLQQVTKQRREITLP